MTNGHPVAVDRLLWNDAEGAAAVVAAAVAAEAGVDLDLLGIEGTPVRHSGDVVRDPTVEVGAAQEADLPHGEDSIGTEIIETGGGSGTEVRLPVQDTVLLTASVVTFEEIVAEMDMVDMVIEMVALLEDLRLHTVNPTTTSMAQEEALMVPQAADPILIAANVVVVMKALQVYLCWSATCRQILHKKIYNRLSVGLGMCVTCTSLETFTRNSQRVLHSSSTQIPIWLGKPAMKWTDFALRDVSSR